MGEPIPARIVAILRQRLKEGTLTPGDRLESTRVLATQLGVSRGSVVTAYEQLVGEGLLVADPSGTRVNPALPVQAEPSRGRVTTPAHNTSAGLLTPGRPDTSLLTTRTWRAAWRAAAAKPTAHPAPGSMALRRLIAEHVRLTRSVDVNAENVLITAGARDGLRSLLMVVGGPVAVDNPGYPTLHSVPRAAGLEIIPIAMDEQGMSVAELERTQPAVVLVMPNHLYPTGRQMAPERRVKLMEWARSSGAVLVEDDYDSELRAAHPALAALDERAVLLGSFAKTLTPALGLGYLVVPDSLIDIPVTPVSGIVQDAMRFFMEADGLRQHTARMRRLYRRRREVVAEVFPEAVAMDGGLHAVIEISPGKEAEVVARCRDAGFGVAGLREYWSAAEKAGVVLGVGGVDEDRLRSALLKLRGLIGAEVV